MPDVARHEMDKSFESYRCFTVVGTVGRKHIYYYLPKNDEKSLMITQRVLKNSLDYYKT